MRWVGGVDPGIEEAALAASLVTSGRVFELNVSCENMVGETHKSGPDNVPNG